MDTSIYESLCLADATEIRTCKYDNDGLKYSSDGKKLLKSKGGSAICWIKDGVEFICKGAFKGDKTIEYVEVPASVKYIGSEAFGNCTSLSRISFPKGLVYIGENAFKGTSIKDVDLSESLIEKIEPRSFRFCKKLKNVWFPVVLKNIGEDAFAGSKLELIDLSKTEVTEIQSGAFAATYAKEIYLPSSLKRVENSAFSFTEITTIKIPDSVEFLGEFAFTSQELEEATLPKGLKDLRHSAIRGVEMKLSSSSPNFLVDGNAIFSKDKTILYDCFSNEYKIPASVKEIKPKCFSGSYGEITFDKNCKIENISDEAFVSANIVPTTIPKTVKFIGNRSFSKNSFFSFRIPENVETIGNEAFEGCWCLEDIYIPTSVKSIGKDVFEGCIALEAIKVPVGSKGMMKTLLPEYEDLISEEVSTENVSEECDDIPDEMNNEANNEEYCFYDYPVEKCSFEIISDITAKLTGLEISNIEVNVVGDYQLEFHFDVEGKIKENFLLSVAFYDEGNNIRETDSICYFDNRERGYKSRFSKHIIQKVCLNKSYTLVRKVRLFIG